MTEVTRLTKAVSATAFIGNPYAMTTYRAGNIGTNSSVETPASFNQSNPMEMDAPIDYRDEVRQCRFFYRYDPLASTVINRMVDMAAGRIKNKRGLCTDEEIAYFNSVADMINPYISAMMLEFLVTGMSIPDFGLTRVMGSKVHPALGRKRYQVPDPFWLRNPDHIILRRMPATQERAVYLVIPEEERTFIINKGRRTDGQEDRELYELVVRKFPEYVKAILDGKREIRLDNTRAILRKPVTHSDNPQPFLVPSLAPMKHKWRIKQMDYSVATRAIEAIRQVSVGNDLFPVTEDDPALEEVRQQMSNRPGQYQAQDSLYTLYTNHTVNIKWIYPPLEALLSETKYLEPNADILLGMGFSRVLLVGESLRSNSGGDASTMGPISALNEMRSNIIHWVRYLYGQLADANGFRAAAEPVFPAIASSEMHKLIQFAVSAVKLNVMSYDTLLQMFGSDYEAEFTQKTAEVENGMPAPDLTAVPVAKEVPRVPVKPTGTDSTNP